MCADVMIQSDPAFPLCLDGTRFDHRYLSSVCKLNGKDFPPSWAEGWSVLEYNILYDKAPNNQCNGVLDHTYAKGNEESLKDPMLHDSETVNRHLELDSYDRDFEL